MQWWCTTWQDTVNSTNKISLIRLGDIMCLCYNVYFVLLYFASFNLVRTLWRERPIMALPNQAACCHSDHDHPALFGQVLLATVCVPCSYMYKKKSLLVTVKNNPWKTWNYIYEDWHFKREKSVFWKASFLQNKNWLRVQDFVYKTS